MSVADNAVTYVCASKFAMDCTPWSRPLSEASSFPYTIPNKQSSEALSSHPPFFSWSAIKRAGKREMQWNCSVILPVNGEKITKGIQKEERRQQIKG